MFINVQHISMDAPNNRRPGIAMEPEYLTIHSTANPDSTAQNERDWLINPSNTRTASWHLVVDDKEVIEAIPQNEVAWHAGDGRKGTGNKKSISIEICESNDREKTIINAVKLSAKILHERKWGIDRLKRHYDWSGKHCPRILECNNWSGWENFKIMVSKELEELSISTWAKEAVDWATSSEINITDGTKPKESITLERMITILYRYDKLIQKK
ncbi:N-acetylmuramoyl-L-alanine amidase [Proteiniborus sp.]|uniref:peptidoglycan recognition protein family protein n=1 Tax=Proteiniborus sp. TaxID=2079015 RepID=UPI00332D35E8